MTDLFEQRLREAARSLPVPNAPEGLIDHVIARRTAGERVILPVDSPRRRGATLLKMVAIAAAILILATTYTSRARRDSVVEPVSSVGQFFLSPAAAYASTPRGTTAPQAPPLAGINALALGGRRFDYRIQFVDTNGKVTPDGDGVLRIFDAQHDNTPAWRVEHVAHLTENGQLRLEGETLFVAKRDLRLLSRVVHQAPYLRYTHISIAQRFVGDSVVGQMTTDGGVRRPIAQRLPPAFAPFLSDGLAPIALVGVPITANWQASLGIVGWAVRDYDVYYPVTLRVVGSETLRTASGAVDCWKIHVSAGSQQRIEWVRKSDGIALRSVDDGPPGPRGRREFVLVNP